MYKTRSFRTKLWSFFVLFAAVLFVLLWLLQTVFLQGFYDRMMEENTRKAASLIAKESSSEEITSIIDQQSLDNSLQVFITDLDGNILYSSDSFKFSTRPSQEENKPNENNPYHQGETMSWQSGSYRNLPQGYGEFLTALKSSSDGNTEIKKENQFIYGSLIELQNGSQAALYVSSILSTTGATASIIRQQLLWVSLLSLLLAFILAWFLARKFSLPVDQLSWEAKMLAKETFEPVFQKGFCRELDELAASLETTAENLAVAKRYQREFLSNISHDLRTPLTMMKGYAEMVRDVSWQDEEERNADLGIILRETDRLTALVNEILEYSRLQEAKNLGDFKETDISLLIKEVIRQFEPLCRAKGIQLEEKIEENCTASVDRSLLERAVYNLLDNAQRHTEKKALITVTLKKENGILLSVQDYGEGIDEKDLPHIWEKYYTSRQRSGKGVSGLGLAIVQRIAQIHGAEYGVLSKKGEGSTFYLKLKK